MMSMPFSGASDSSPLTIASPSGADDPVATGLDSMSGGGTGSGDDEDFAVAFSQSLAADPAGGDGSGDAAADPLGIARPLDDATDPGGPGAALLRLAPGYGARLGVDIGGDDPLNPRAISNAIFRQAEDMPSRVGYSNLLWVWGQFLDHDLSLTEAHPGGVAAAIAVPTGDPFFDPLGTGAQTIGFTRVTPLAPGADGSPPLYANEITAYLDASNVYGSTAAQLAAIRAPGGKVVLDEDGLIALDADDKAIAGDVRAPENVALASMHALFAREHNRLVDELSAADPTLDDDALFLAARARVEAIQQAITYNEFLPILIGDDAIAAYDGYDPTVDPQVSVEFSTAVFRLGHTMLSSTLARVDETGATIAAGDLQLRDAFFAPEALATGGGVDPLFRGLAGTFSQELDAFVVEDVRSFLFGPPGAGGFDLVALNIQRGRDLDLPAYNDLREALGLGRVDGFADITSDAALAGRLEAAYGDVDLVDAWVGGLAEDAVGGGLLGELFSTVMIDQFSRIRDGDAFWSQGRGFDGEELDSLWSTRLSDVILRNSGVEHLQVDAFHAYARQGGGEGRDMLRGGDRSDLLIGFGGDDYLFGGDGADQLEGDAGADMLFGQNGDDRLVGGLGADRLYGGAGDDVVLGGAGADMLMGDSGDDRLEGGAGADVLRGGFGDDELSGGAGADSFLFHVAEAGANVVTDFDFAEDRLMISGTVAMGGLWVSEADGWALLHAGSFSLLLEGVTPTEWAESGLFA